MSLDRYPDELHHCRCADTGWIETLTGAVHPCPDCRPVQHLRWREGHYGRDHTCPECGAIREGKTHHRDVAARLGARA